MIANVYVDGFNLYYGAIKDTEYKWLDLAKLSALLLPRDTIHRIRYFTARINARPDDPQQPQRQQVYFRALETIPSLSVHYGHFLSGRKRMALAIPAPDGARTVEVLTTEEKGSDVNLATYLLLDAMEKECELAVIMSNDSDFKLPVEVVRTRFGVRVGVFSPHPTLSRALGNVATFQKRLPKSALRASQFPAALWDAHGVITKPSGW